jgi:hypothetical protein
MRVPGARSLGARMAYAQAVVALPDTRFDLWMLDEVAAATEGEPVDVMPGSGRRLPGPRRKLLEAMQTAGVVRAGDLSPRSVTGIGSPSHSGRRWPRPTASRATSCP